MRRAEGAHGLCIDEAFHTADAADSDGAIGEELFVTALGDFVFENLAQVFREDGNVLIECDDERIQFSVEFLGTVGE